MQVDAARLAQVISNLLTNAARYTPARGSISVRVLREDGDVLIVVSDSGIGMTPGALEHAFDMFYQGPAMRGAVAQGLGIGLTLARRLVEMHGGSLEARSPGVDQGSEFTIRLPAADAADSRDDSAAGAAADEAVPLRSVLVVDDNTDAA